MRIVICASEAVPFGNTGRLADFASRLATGLATLGHEVWLVVPYYRQHQPGRDTASSEIVSLGVTVEVPILSKMVSGELVRAKLADSNVTVLLVDQPSYFDRNGLYGEAGSYYTDNCERFCFFSRAVVDAIHKLDLQPDVVHANDWQTGLVPALIEIENRDSRAFEKCTTIFSIHDLTDQGIFPKQEMTLTGLDWKHFNWRQMEFYDQLGLLKTGIVFSDMLTTVSPQHAVDICTPEYGMGLEGILSERSSDLVGILSGIEAGELGPPTDERISQLFTPENWLDGKKACKEELQRKVGLPTRPDVPVLATISRVVAQKGFDLLRDAADSILEEDLQWVLMGSGDPEYESFFSELTRRYSDKIHFRPGYDNGLVMLIMAGADIYLMPSKYEPCGVNALYSMLYGAVPLVSAVGGLSNSVSNVTDDTLLDGSANGFTLGEFSVESLCRQIRNALELFRKPAVWGQLVKNNLRNDWSWRRTAAEYVSVYERALRKRHASHPVLASHAARTAPFKIVDTLVVERKQDKARIELCVGDLTQMDPAEDVDVLVVSAFPDDYSSQPGSLIHAVEGKGISVEKLAAEKAVDLRKEFSCWMSRPLDNYPDFPFRRILCFEPLHLGTPPERVGDVFRALAPFVFDSPPVRKLAMPILASGYHQQSPTIMLQLLLESAQAFLSTGMPLTCLQIVAHPPFFLTEPERQDYIERIKKTFNEAKGESHSGFCGPRTRPGDFKYDFFVSYSHQDIKETDFVVNELHKSFPDLRLFLDRSELDPGQAWQHEIFTALDDCWKMLALYSPSYLHSKVCIEEFNIALCRTRDEDRSVVVPIYLYSARLPTYMRLVNYLDCREFDRRKITDTCSSLAQEPRTRL